jgi:hypothetical protein
MIFFMVKVFIKLPFLKNNNNYTLLPFNIILTFKINNLINIYERFILLFAASGTNSNNSNFNFYSNNSSTNNNFNSNSNSKKHKIKPVLHNCEEHKIKNPLNNRGKIADFSKGAKGVYVFINVLTNDCYVGSGGSGKKDLYSRVCFYFMPSTLKNGKRKIEKYLNQNGFDNIELIIYIMNSDSTRTQILELEQYFIDKLKPNLNVCLSLSAGDYLVHRSPMSEEIKKN